MNKYENIIWVRKMNDDKIDDLLLVFGILFFLIGLLLFLINPYDYGVEYGMLPEFHAVFFWLSLLGVIMVIMGIITILNVAGYKARRKKNKLQ